MEKFDLIVCYFFLVYYSIAVGFSILLNVLVKFAYEIEKINEERRLRRVIRKLTKIGLWSSDMILTTTPNSEISRYLSRFLFLEHLLQETEHHRIDREDPRVLILLIKSNKNDIIE